MPSLLQRVFGLPHKAFLPGRKGSNRQVFRNQMQQCPSFIDKTNCLIEELKVRRVARSFSTQLPSERIPSSPSQRTPALLPPHPAPFPLLTLRFPRPPHPSSPPPPPANPPPPVTARLCPSLVMICTLTKASSHRWFPELVSDLLACCAIYARLHAKTALDGSFL